MISYTSMFLQTFALVRVAVLAAGIQYLLDRRLR